MKFSKLVFVLFSSFLATLIAEKVNIGVMNFSSEGVSELQAKLVTDLFRGELVQSGKFIVIDRNNMDKILNEQSFQNSGCTDSSCAVEIGKILNMQQMVYGVLVKIGENYYLTVEVVDVESAAIVLSANKKAESFDVIDKTIESLVSEISGVKEEIISLVSSEKASIELKVISPDDVFVKVNGEQVESYKSGLLLSKGEHKIYIYKDGYIPKELVVIVDGGENLSYVIELDKGIDSTFFLASKNDFRKNTIFGLGFGVLSLSAYWIGINHYDKGEENYKNYQDSENIQEADELGDSFETSYKKGLYYTSGAYGLGIITSLYLFKGIKNNKVVREYENSLSFHYDIENASFVLAGRF